MGMETTGRIHVLMDVKEVGKNKGFLGSASLPSCIERNRTFLHFLALVYFVRRKDSG